MTDRINRQLRQRILDHTLTRLTQIDVDDDPFPHIVISRFFPDDVYDSLHAAMPPESAFEKYISLQHRDNYGEFNRTRFHLLQDRLDQLSPGAQEFWYTLRSVLGSTELKEAVFDKLQLGLSRRLWCHPSKARTVPGYALPEVFRELTGYNIKPHPDTRRKLITMQISLATDESQKDIGTEFYRRSLNPADWRREPKGFEIAKTMPFLPNTAYAFVVLNGLTLKSWHGRTTIREGSGIRLSLLNIWYAKAEDAHPELLDEYAASPPVKKAA